jgi:hypothetical protein
MRHAKMAVLLAALVPAMAFAGVTRNRGAQDETLWLWQFAAAAATGSCPNTGTGCSGYFVPAGKRVTLSEINAYVNVAGGGGAGTTVLTASDGTNACTFTILCSATGAGQTGAKQIAGAAGTGTGCTFLGGASGVTLAVNISTAGCTTTQPTFKHFAFVGTRQ